MFILCNSWYIISHLLNHNKMSQDYQIENTQELVLLSPIQSPDSVLEYNIIPYHLLDEE